MQKTIKLTGGMAAAVLALLVFAALSVTGCEQPGQEDTAAYTVTFNADGGTPAPDQQTVVSRGNVTQPPVMTKTGYTFDGWYKEDTFTAKWDFDIDTVTGTITLFAKWDINRYTVTFNADGGTSAPVQQTVDHGGKVTQPAAMTKTGFGFGGWFKEAELANQWDFATDTVIGDITLYASWDRSFFTVTFNADGGTPAPTQKNIAHDSKVVEPAAMAKTGYTFGGWYKEAALTNQWNFANDTVTAVTTIYAKWTLNQYIVTFNADGGTPTPAQQTVDHGGKVTQPPAMTRTGYTFGGWYKESALTNQWVFATDTVTATTTIYAKWTLNQYAVTFSPDGGTPTPAQQTVDHGGKVTQPPAMTRTGYTFGGWYKESALTNQWVFATDTVTAEITLYAKWTLNRYTVTFNANSGTPTPAQQTVDHGGKVTQPPAMTRTGYTFGGWYKEADFTNVWSFAGDAVTANTTIYAKWTPITYTILYDKNATDAGGTMANSVFTYNVDVNLRTNSYSRSGYRFTGWNTQANGQGTVYTNGQSVINLTATTGATITLYAQWEDLDFAPGEVIHQTFTVVNLNTWNTARSAINSGGNGRTYLINYSAEISVSGSTANTFSPSNIKVVIRGSGEILMTYGTTGRALTVGQNQTVIVRDIRLRGNSDNNSAIVHVAGKLDLKGSANIYSNLNIATNARGSGTYVDSTGTLTMWDDSYIDNNQINTMTTDTNNLFGGGVFVMGTFIMRDNARITNNKITYQWSYWRGSGGGVYVSNTASAIFRMAGGWIEGRGPRNENIAQTGSALYVTSPGVAEYGSFIGETWIKEGNLDTTDNTIRVADGVLQ